MITLSECMSRINQVLNYPAMDYLDISHFFDQAISELNTTFKIGLPLVSQMVKERKLNVQELPNLVYLPDAPMGYNDITTGDGVTDLTDTTKAYYNTSNGLFYKYNTSTEQWEAYSKVYGIYLDDSFKRHVFESVPAYGAQGAFWSLFDESRQNDFDLATYIPDDWVILFLIPYVCFKASVRDGGSGTLYTEEYTQGFQQLQTSYDVPNFVRLSEVAHLEAYKPLVEQNLANLNISVPTRAVYDSMKVGGNILPIFGGFYTGGGWGV